MFIYKINRWLDQYDLYWHNRYLSFKVAYILIIIFIANMLCRPQEPIYFLLLAPWAMNCIEVPSINRYQQKDLTIVWFFLLTALTVLVFDLIIYYRVFFVLVGGLYCFILYYFVVNYYPSLKGVGVLALVTALVGISDNKSGDFYLAINQLLIIFVAGIITFWANKVFPNLYHYKWQSAVARSLEEIITGIKGGLADKSYYINQFMESYQQVYQVLPLLLNKQSRYSYFKFSKYLIMYSYWLPVSQEGSISKEQLELIAQDLKAFSLAIIQMKLFTLPKTVDDTNDTLSADFQFHHQLLVRLSSYWNEICGKI